MKLLLLMVILLGVTWVLPTYAPTHAAKESATVRLVIANCFETEKLSVPINRSFRRGGIGIGGGGNGSCNYSYNLHAVRIDRNHVNLFVNVTVTGRSFEKQIALARDKPVDVQLEPGVRVLAHL